MPSLSRISRNNTTVTDDSVTLHRTCIVQRLPDGRTRLCTGGWLTATTMTRMNQVAREWGLSFSVGRAGGDWRIRWNGREWIARGDTVYLRPGPDYTVEGADLRQ